MKHFTMFLIGLVLCMQMHAQNFSNDISLIDQDETSVTVIASAVAEKKKDAKILAAKSAFHTLLHSGIKGVKNGVPITTVERKDYDYRFFNEDRYINYIRGEIQDVDDAKINGRHRVYVRLTILTKSLCSDLEYNKIPLSPGWSDPTKVKSTASLNPTIVIIPQLDASDGEGFEDMRNAIESDPIKRHVIDQLANEFNRHDFKTRDFVSILNNSKNSALIRQGSQTDIGTQIVQVLPGDIIVTVDIRIETDRNRQSECILGIRAVENQTNGNLASVSFASGKYYTSNGNELANYALRKIKSDFFTQLKNSFEDMVTKGREVYIDMTIAETVTDWDFEQDTPVSGEYFKDALEEWLRSHAHQSVYDMSNSTDKYIHATINVPLWNHERNRSYTLSNFSSDLRRFFKKHLGDNYKASITAMGQKLEIVIE